jgi:glycosyltransferase involved in cell wall biosynthesis
MWRGPGTRRMSIPEVGFAIPGDLDTRTGGYGYDRRLIAGLGARGFAIRHLAWAGGFPLPDGPALAAAARSLASQPDGRIVIVDGLAFGAIPELAAEEGERLQFVALIHHPLVLETDAPRAFHAAERDALRHARAVIVTSEATAETLCREYDVPIGRLLVAPPGTDPAPLAPRQGRPPHLLSVGAVTPRKAHDILVEALVRIADLPWRCTIAGSLDRAPDAVRNLRAQIETSGLRSRITLKGEVEDVESLFAAADVFVLASRHEGFGMAYAEALARGLPIIGTLAGAIPDVVPREAGALVPPDDPAALANALRHLLSDQEAREAAASAARQAGARLPRWEATIDSVASLLRGLS